MLQNSQSEYGLLLLGETASKLVNPNDKSIAMMYGDAGAAILYKKITGALLKLRFIQMAIDLIYNITSWWF